MIIRPPHASFKHLKTDGGTTIDTMMTVEGTVTFGQTLLDFGLDVTHGVQPDQRRQNLSFVTVGKALTTALN